MNPRIHCLLMVAGIFSMPVILHATPVDFEKDILPILEDYCIDCHGDSRPKSGFRVDGRAFLLKGGDGGFPAVVPGDPEKSYLMEVITGVDPEMQMPPKGDTLLEDEIELVRQWIEEGAVWPGQMDDVIEEEIDHWSFLPVERPALPSDDKNPIDGFLMEKLLEEGLEPNGAADSLSLIRRVTILLTGLPPTPERAAAFEKDHGADSEAAYAELVEELLASPHFGERWAQHWLDVIRWAETNGSEANLYRKNAWIYRDYVIRAFNEDIPYDRFVRDQLAGDQFGVGEATGFLVAGPHVPAATVGREPTAIRQARADRMDEVMQTVGASMMAMTMSCARCHNHKFDPISIQDYYSMSAVFQGVEFGGRRPELAKDHPRQQRALEIWPEMNKEREILRNGVGQWLEDWGGYHDFNFPSTKTRAIRVEFVKGNVGIDELDVYGPAEKNRNLARAAFGTKLKTDPEMTKKGHDLWKANDGQFGTMAWRTQVPKGSDKKAWVEIHFHSEQEVNRFRFSANREYYFETDYLNINSPFLPGFRISALHEDGTWREVGKTNWSKALINREPDLKASHERLQEHIASISEEGPRHSFVGRFIEPATTYVLHRGSPENPRDEVVPGAPLALNGMLGLPGDAPEPNRRVAFADWMTEPSNPLTARVMVNRIWHHIFGMGIVPTPSDFGRAGAAPSHPELLDWLAAEFVEPTMSEGSPWSMKDMIRLIVLSEAFQRSSLPTEEGMAVDAGSSLLWRFPPKRVAAEVIRDGVLQASDKLDRTIGGRSYRIHNVKKTYAQWEVVDNHGEETWRRMIYQERMRRVDDKIFTAFDFPDCGQVRAQRPISTTPLQALNLMNSDFVVTQSAKVAQRANAEAGEELEASVRRCFELLLTRQPEPSELTAAVEVAKASGLEVVCRSLINSNEFAFLP